MQALKERYQELVSRKDNLPYKFNMRMPDDFDLDLILSYLPKNFFPTDPSDSFSKQEVNEVAFLMALFGWQGHSHARMGAQLGSLSCQACYRVLGLWLFKSKAVSESGEEIEGPIVNGLDVVLEHRDYCPWRNPMSQNGQSPTVKTATNKLAGWEILVRLLKSESQLRTAKVAPKPKAIVPVTEDTNQPEAEEIDDEDARSIRDEQDKERWARLRRVKSLFEPKGGKKVRRGEPTTPDK